MRCSLEFRRPRIIALGWQAEFFRAIRILSRNLLGSALLSQPLGAHRDPSPIRREAGSALLDRDCLGL